MAANKKTIIAAIGNPNLKFEKAGLHQYYFEYTDAEAGIYCERKTFHVRTVSQFPLEKWVTLGNEFIAGLVAKQ